MAPSEIRTTSQQRTKVTLSMCLLFGGSTVLPTHMDSPVPRIFGVADRMFCPVRSEREREGRMITDQICQHNGKTTTTADLNDLID